MDVKQGSNGFINRLSVHIDAHRSTNVASKIAVIFAAVTFKRNFFLNANLKLQLKDQDNNHVRIQFKSDRENQVYKEIGECCDFVAHLQK